MNICTYINLIMPDPQSGMMYVASTCFRLKPHSLLLSSPDCRPWLWMTRFTMGRCFDEYGYTSRQDVRDSNHNTAFDAWLYVQMHQRDVYVLQEQPARSSQPTFPPMDCALGMIDAYKVHTWMGAFGNPIPKPTIFWTTLPSDAAAKLIRDKPKSMDKEVQKKHHFISRTGWVCGTSNLKSTQEFTVEFAKALVEVAEMVAGS